MPQLKLDRNLIIMCATMSINVLIIFTWNPLLPLHLRVLGASDWELGISFTLIGIARTLFAVVGGAMADRFGRKILLTAPHLASAFLYLLAGAVTNWVALVAILIATNALNALINPAFNAIIAESVPEDRVARAFSASEAAVLLGLILGPLAGAALVPIYNIPTLIGLYGWVLLLTAAVRYFGIVDAARPVRSATLKLRAAIDSRIVWYIVAFSLVQMAFGICFGPYFAILARDAWGNNASEINLLFALGSLASMLGIPFGQRADRWGKRRVAIIGLFVFGLTVAGWGIAPTWQWGLAPLVLAFFFSEGGFIAILAMQAQITTRESRASVMGIIATVSGVIAGLGPVLAAALIEWGGNAMPFIACGVMSLGAIAAVRRLEKTERARVVDI